MTVFSYLKISFVKRLANSKSVRLIVVTGLGMGVTLLFDLLLAYKLGTSARNDALIIGLAIPIFLDTVFRESVRLGILPVLIMSKGDSYKIGGFLLIWFFFLGIILFIILQLTSSWLVGLVGYGLSEQSKLMANSIFLLLSYSVIFTPVNSILSARLNALGKFNGPALRNMIVPLITIIYVLVNNDFHVTTIAVGMILGFITFFLILVYLNYKYNIRYSRQLVLTRSLINDILHSIGYPFIGFSIRNFTRILERTIASTILIGGVSSYYFAYRLFTAVQGLVGMPFAVTGIVSFSGSQKELSKRVWKHIMKLLIIVVPISIFLYFFSDIVVRLLFFRGNFNTESLNQTVSALKGLSWGITFFCIAPSIEAALYSIGKYRIVMIINIVLAILGITLAYFLALEWGIIGLAISVSLTSFLGLFSLTISFIIAKK